MSHPWQRQKKNKVSKAAKQRKDDRPLLPEYLKATREAHQTLDDGRVHIYTDGSCDRKNSSGGWGAYLICADKERMVSGARWGTTIGAMEVQAVLEAIRCLRNFDRPTIVYSDSQYVVQALTVWWRGWGRRGFLTASGKPVKHLEMLKEIRETCEGRPVAFRWVKGHAGIAGNEVADRLAGAARRDLVMLARLMENIPKMSDDIPLGAEQWRIIAKRHVDGLHDVFSDSRGWACKHPIMLWTYYLTFSYMYYERDYNIISDTEFDNLCRYLLKLGKDHLKESKVYWVDKLFDEGCMEAGTGYHLKGKLPIGVQNIAELMMREVGFRAIDGRTNPDNYLKDHTSRKRVRARAEPVQEQPAVRVRARTRSTGESNATVSKPAAGRVRQRTRNRS